MSVAFSKIFSGSDTHFRLLQKLSYFSIKETTDRLNRNNAIIKLINSVRFGAAVIIKSTEMRKQTRPLARKKKIFLSAIIIPAALVLVLLALFLTTDIYINRAYLAKKHLSRAFEARITGNCDEFYEYILKDIEGWRAKCVSEKNLTVDPFYGYKTLKATVRGDKAYVQMELVRGAYKDTYPVTYEMKLMNGKWLINQNSNQ